MKDLNSYRQEIDLIDDQIRQLFLTRMEIVGEVAKIKMNEELTVYDHKREEEIISSNLSKITDDLFKDYYKEVLEQIMKVSKDYQKYLIIRSTL
ncbi:MAG: chorismate mutase [Candidatus Izemoplasmatales bacterium]|jgi:monofunctional chorismate mutase|nr:chorismate mutase [Candidatus Izemoplasmatales bacterium]